MARRTPIRMRSTDRHLIAHTLTRFPMHRTSVLFAESDSTIANYIIAGGVLVLVVLALVSLSKKTARRKRSTHSSGTARERIDAIKARARQQVATDVTVASQVDQITMLAAQLDTRARRLEQLIVDADARIMAMESRGQPHGQTDGAASARRSDSVRGFANRDLFSVPATPDRSRAVESPSAGESNGDDADPGRRLRDVTTQAIALADDGLPAAEIARRLGEPVGRIELMLALRKPRSARGDTGGRQA